MIHTNPQVSSDSIRFISRYNTAIKVFILVATICILNVLSISVWSPQPVLPADVVIFVNQSQYGPVVMEVRKYIGKDDGETVSSTRYFYKENDPTSFFQVESGSFKQMKGEFPVLTSTNLPKWVSGRWCVRTELSWWPSFSQREFNITTKDVCFETTEYE